jgi:hypothetical protein
MTLADAFLFAGAAVVGLICWICPGVLFAAMLGWPVFSLPGIALTLGWLPFAGFCFLAGYLAILLAASAVMMAGTLAKMIFGK